MRAEGLDVQLTQAARAGSSQGTSAPGGYPGAAPAGFPA
jgi:hypothetical protein